MILTIDVGNTNITCGVFQGDEIAASFRITTKMPRTSDEYGMMLMNLLEQNDIHPAEIKDAIICSVVPNVMHSLRGGLVKYFHITPIVVEAGIKTGIRIVTPNPQQIGADRIVDAVGAYERKENQPEYGRFSPLITLFIKFFQIIHPVLPPTATVRQRYILWFLLRSVTYLSQF